MQVGKEICIYDAGAKRVSCSEELAIRIIT